MLVESTGYCESNKNCLEICTCNKIPFDLMPTKAAAVVPTSFTSFPSPSPYTHNVDIHNLTPARGECGVGEQHKLTNQKTENRNQKTENHESCYRCDLSSEPFRHMKQYPSTLLSWSLSTCQSLSGTFVVINAVIKLEPPVKWPSWQISISISLSISSIQWVDVPTVWPSASQTTWVCLSFNCYRHAAHLISSCRISTLYSPLSSYFSFQHENVAEADPSSASTASPYQLAFLSLAFHSLSLPLFLSLFLARV